jgi:hypothetical protein
MVGLFLGVLKNNWQLAALVLSIVTGAAFWKGEHVLLLHTRTELAAKIAVINDCKRLALEQDARAQQVDAQQRANHDLIQSQLDSALSAHRLSGDALTASVLKFENDRSRRQVCPGSGTAPGILDTTAMQAAEVAINTLQRSLPQSPPTARP